MRQAFFKAAAIVLTTSVMLALLSGAGQAQAAEITIGVTLSASGRDESLSIPENVSKTEHSAYDKASRVLVRVQDGGWRIVQ